MRQLNLSIWILTLALAACGPSARQKSINTTLAALNTSSEIFVKFDASHQQAIVDRAPSKAVGEQQLTDYRAKQLVVAQSFAAAYRAVAVAQQLTNDQSLSSMMQAALIVATELHALGVL